MSKMKQTYMKAVFGKRADNAVNMGSDKEIISQVRIIDKKTERTIVDFRAYMGKSRNTSTVYGSLWVHQVKDKPEDWEYGETSGKGSAGGYGYHKVSTVAASAIESAGITLYGSPYGHPVNNDTPAQTRAMLKQRADIWGRGDGAVTCALCAIAYAAGFNDCIVVRS